MRIIDNYDLIAPRLHRENENEFYMVQIIQRRKDSGEGGTQHRVIKEYFIFSLESLESKYPEMKKLCILFNARAYIRLSRRNTETMAKRMIIELGNAFKNNSFKHLRKIYSTVVGRDTGLDKIWIIDIDKELNTLEIMELLKCLYELKPVGVKVVDRIETVKGCHYLSKPFDLKEFRKSYPEMDVHKNNPTLLYYFLDEEKD